MKRRLAYWLAKGLYPAAWRARYGDEFDALVEDSRPGWRGLADIAQAGLALQFQMPVTPARTALAFGLAALILAIPGMLLIRDSFISMASLRAPSVDIRGAVGLAQQAALRREAISALIDRHKLYPEIQDRGAQIERFQRNTKVTGLTPLRDGTAAFRVGFQYDDAAKARAVTQELMTTLIDTFRRQNASGPGLDVLDMASLPQQPISPNRPVAITMCLLAAAALGALVAMIRLGGALPILRHAALGALAGGLVVMLAVAARGLAPPTAAAAIEVKKDVSDSSINTVPLSRYGKDLWVGPVHDEPNGHRVIRLSYRHPDAYRARTVLREVMTTIVDAHPGKLEVLQMPTVTPLRSVPGDFPTVLKLGLVLGALLGTIVAAFRWKPLPQPQLS